MVLEGPYKTNKDQCNIKYIYLVRSPTNQPNKSAMVHPTNVLRHNKLSTPKLRIIWNFVVHSFWNELGSLWRGQLVHYIHFLGNFCLVLFVSSPIWLGTRNETCNILESKCFGHVEPSRIMIMTPKLITKLGFGFGIIIS